MGQPPAPATEKDPAPARRPLRLKHPMEYGRSFWVMLALLALLDAIAVYAAVFLASDGAWLFLASLLVGVAFINWVYLWPGTRALRWVTPGLILMIIFLVVPIGYTFYISFTNWATGNVLSKQQVIDILESRSVVDPDNPGEILDMYVYRDGDEVRLLLIGQEGDLFFGEPRQRNEEPLGTTAEDPSALGISDPDGDGIPDQIGAFRLLTRPELFGLANQMDFDQLIVDLPAGQVETIGLSQGRVVLATSGYRYDAASDTLQDLINDQTCTPGEAEDEEGHFVCEDGTVISPGWVAPIGVRNYSDILANENIRGPFFGVFIWNLVFALLSVLFTFALGLGLALTVQHSRFRGKLFFRSIFILPYAVPAFLSILIWQGLLNSQYGQVNELLGALGLGPVRWLTDPFWAKVAVLLVNTWLGFPYMFLISMGALTSIPVELQEAARVDGASAFGVFRRVTFPLLMVGLAPLLIGSFAFNFNNFVIIYLLTTGGPPILTAAVPVGATDILITFTFDLVVAGGGGNRYGLGAAITVFIFLMVTIISAISFRFTRRLEEIYGSL